MAFCKGGMSAVRHIWAQITPELEEVVDKVTDVTKIIKDFKDGPIGDLVQLIPGATEVVGWLGVAIDAVTGLADATRSIEEKITAYLAAAPTEYDKNGKLLKLASVAVAIGHQDKTGERKSESFYDSAVQLHIITEKAAAA